MKIAKIYAQEVLDSRGNPTVLSTLVLDDGRQVQSAVPSGASTGSHEAVELRDGDASRYGGKGVLQAVANVNEIIAPALQGREVNAQETLDKIMIDLDGTPNKGKLGANAILSVSMAITKASAVSKNVPLYQHVADLFGNDTHHYLLPVPMMNVLNGGKHAIKSSDMQEFMLMPIGLPNVAEAVRAGAEIFHTLGKILKERGFATTVGDEGGYAPSLGNNEAPLELMVTAIEKAGYAVGTQVAIALDPAASEFYEAQTGKYQLATENLSLTSDELIAKYDHWLEQYPIVSIEDGLAEDDWDGFVKQTALDGQRLQIVGDDLFVTNIERLQKGIDLHAGNSILIKLNQIGTVTETIKAIQLAKNNGYTAVVSHRSGETADTFIADFVVGAGTGQIKTGSASRSERIAKYNRLMMIERELGERAQLAQFPFAR
ncbi:phosphopyruvate hydratase [bacterium]|nr:phosphopyruvate hydratase [bacterium]